MDRTHTPARSRLVVSALLIAFGVCAPAAAFGPRERVDHDTDSEPMEVAMLSNYVDREIRVVGAIGAYGSMPHVWIGLLTGDASEETDGEPPGPQPPLLRFDEPVLFELIGEGAEALWDLQGSLVTVTGILRQTAVGPGFPARLEVADYRLEKR